MFNFIKKIYQENSFGKVNRASKAEYIPLSKAKRIAFIFKVTDDSLSDNFLYIQDLLSMNNIDAHFYGWDRRKEKEIKIDGYPSFLIADNIKIFKNKDLNWYNKPSNIIIKSINSQHFDIVIDLSDGEDFILNFIFAITNSSFKVGVKSDQLSYCDMVIAQNISSDQCNNIDISQQSKNAEKLKRIKSIFKYLEIIKTTDN